MKVLIVCILTIAYGSSSFSQLTNMSFTLKEVRRVEQLFEGHSSDESTSLIVQNILSFKIDELRKVIETKTKLRKWKRAYTKKPDSMFVKVRFQFLESSLKKVANNYISFSLALKKAKKGRFREIGSFEKKYVLSRLNFTAEKKARKNSRTQKKSFKNLRLTNLENFILSNSIVRKPERMRDKFDERDLNKQIDIDLTREYLSDTNLSEGPLFGRLPSDQGRVGSCYAEATGVILNSIFPDFDPSAKQLAVLGSLRSRDYRFSSKDYYKETYDLEKSKLLVNSLYSSDDAFIEGGSFCGIVKQLNSHKKRICSIESSTLDNQNGFKSSFKNVPTSIREGLNRFEHLHLFYKYELTKDEREWLKINANRVFLKYKEFSYSQNFHIFAYSQVFSSFYYYLKSTHDFTRKEKNDIREKFDASLIYYLELLEKSESIDQLAFELRLFLKNKISLNSWKTIEVHFDEQAKFIKPLFAKDFGYFRKHLLAQKSWVHEKRGKELFPIYFSEDRNEKLDYFFKLGTGFYERTQINIFNNIEKMEDIFNAFSSYFISKNCIDSKVYPRLQCRTHSSRSYRFFTPLDLKQVGIEFNEGYFYQTQEYLPVTEQSRKNYQKLKKDERVVIISKPQFDKIKVIRDERYLKKLESLINYEFSKPKPGAIGLAVCTKKLKDIESVLDFSNQRCHFSYHALTVVGVRYTNENDLAIKLMNSWGKSCRNIDPKIKCINGIFEVSLKNLAHGINFIETIAAEELI